MEPFGLVNCAFPRNIWPGASSFGVLGKLPVLEIKAQQVGLAGGPLVWFAQESLPAMLTQDVVDGDGKDGEFCVFLGIWVGHRGGET